MKKYSLLLIIIIILCSVALNLSACTQPTEDCDTNAKNSKEINETIKNFFFYLEQGDVDNAMDYLSDSQASIYNSVFDIAFSAGVSEDTVNNAVKEIFENSSYTIDSITANQATVTVEMDDFVTITDTYVEKLVSNLGTIEGAVAEAIIHHKLKDFTDNAVGNDVFVTLSLDIVEENGKFLISGYSVIED
jgi:hypothetical protein